ncbi:MAG: hypothetical protein NTV65_10580 [Proteobacteria bacterium]|jgi:hypothetical protein|nr:hypothetical protein [Pseudomonadota bacterium]
MEESWSRIIEVDGERFEVLFIRRPFREGLEVRVDVRGTIIAIAELGLGESALVEQATVKIRQELAKR